MPNRWSIMGITNSSFVMLSCHEIAKGIQTIKAIKVFHCDDV